MLRSNRGFTLAEMMIVILLMGLMLAFAIPAFRRLGNSQGLKGAKENIVSQLQLARAKAISTGVDSPPIHFNTSYGSGFHLHPAGVGVPNVNWLFSNGVTYGTPGYSASVIMYKNGTASTSLIIPLMNAQGVRDTVAVLQSGLVVAQ